MAGQLVARVCAMPWWHCVVGRWDTCGAWPLLPLHLLGWRPCPFGAVRSRLPCLAHMPSHQYVPGCLAGALQGCIVNNESSEIVRMFNSEFNHLAGNPDLDL